MPQTNGITYTVVFGGPEPIVIRSLAVYAIYDNPTDYPDKFVLRRWDVGGPNFAVVPQQDVVVVDTLEEARAAVPPGFFRYNRDPRDDAKIVETWI